jgi:hypothetical protein
MKSMTGGTMSLISLVITLVVTDRNSSSRMR